MDPRECKRTIRELKRIELRIRYGGLQAAPKGAHLLWDELFGRGRTGRTRFSLEALAAMDKEEFRGVVAEFYLRLYAGNARGDGQEIRRELGLPPDADEEAVKRTLRALIVKNHPDVGGDPNTLIALLEKYREFR